MRTRILALTSSIALLAAACGGGDGDSETADATASETAEETPSDADGGASVADASTFSAELEDGSTLTVRLDVDATDPVIAPFVAFREQSGVADPVVWIVGSLEAPADYDDALGPPTGRFLTFVPEGAERIADSNPTSSFACSELDDWFGAPSGDDAADLNDAYIAVVNDACAGQTLGVIGAIGATTEYAMLVEGESLPEFDGVWAGLLTELQPVG